MILGKMELKNKLKDLSDISIRKGVGKGISLVQADAKSNCGGFKQSTGELMGSIFISLEGGGDTVVGTCFTDKEYATYVEFGTGPVGQRKHEGISPDVNVAYSQNGWIIPGGAMDREKAERYKLGVLEDKDGNPIGYMTNGQPAKPFMYPALKDNEDEIVRIIAKEVKKQL